MGTVMPAVLAGVGGCVIAVALIVPWAAVQYRRRGTLGFGATVIAFAALVYALALVTYTLLPLPADAEAACADGGASRQWHLGEFVRDAAHYGSWNLHNPAVTQVLLN